MQTIIWLFDIVNPKLHLLKIMLLEKFIIGVTPESLSVSIIHFYFFVLFYIYIYIYIYIYTYTYKYIYIYIFIYIIHKKN